MYKLTTVLDNRQPHTQLCIYVNPYRLVFVYIQHK